MSEEELFSDPRASLDKIAGEPPPEPRGDPVGPAGGRRRSGASADESYRDPFRPLGSRQRDERRPIRAARRMRHAGGEGAAFRAHARRRFAAWSIATRHRSNPRAKPEAAMSGRRRSCRPSPVRAVAIASVAGADAKAPPPDAPRPSRRSARPTEEASRPGNAVDARSPTRRAGRPTRASSSASRTARTSRCSRSARLSRSRGSFA